MTYAAVISLKHTIKSLIDPINPEISTPAHEELKFLQDVLKRSDALSNGSINRRAIKALDAKIREAVRKLEDVIQFYVGFRSLPPNDEGVKLELDSFLEIVQKLREEYIRELDEDDALSIHHLGASPIHHFGGRESTMVGLSDQFTEIRDELLDFQSRRKIVSIVGMAGIGKTFLASKIYQSLINVRHSNVPHFNLTAWVTVGPNRKIEDVLVDILIQIQDEPTTSYEEQDKHKLAVCLHKCLFRRKYFIVLDDIWSTEEWGYLMNFFPENKNDSRLLLVTRLENVPYPPDTIHIVHNMRLLSHEESWNLLRQSVFDEQSFARQLEEAGRKIADSCEGLPLLILAVANILRHSELSVKHWKEVASKNNSTFPDAYEHISPVLSSSYEYLPYYLKACFLYMGVFPQYYEIPLTKLINLWTVEDFLEPSQSQTLEDFAMKCLKELVSRSLVIICKHSPIYKIKSCKLHSAYWSLCVKEASKNQFLHVLNKFYDGAEEYIQSQRRISVQNSILLCIKEVYDSIAATSTPRSLLFTGEDYQYAVPVCFDLMFLKVLDALAIRFYEFPSEVLELLQLKYLALTHDGNLPSFISKLQNLQSLILHQYHNIELVSDSSFLPKEIWDMQELRHLRIMGNNLPGPSNGAELPNLLTLHVKGHSCTEDVFRSIPKLKKLGIKIELKPRSTEILSCFEHISILHELESLKCVVVNPRPRSQVVAPPNPSSSFPRGLKKLSLKGLGYSWEYISAIGSLPNLQVLKLRCFAFQGAEWKTEVGEFRSLEFLLLEDIDLVNWKTDDEKCFPRLQRLIIRHCYKIEEIPWQIEEIPTLKMIEIVDCHPSVVEFAQEILKLKQDYGNDTFQVPITSSSNLR